MTDILKVEYECVCRDGSSEFYDVEVDAIAFAEQEECERVEKITRYFDSRSIIWVGDDT